MPSLQNKYKMIQTSAYCYKIQIQMKNTTKISEKKKKKKFCVDMLNISPNKTRNDLKITARNLPEKPGPSPTLISRFYAANLNAIRKNLKH